MFESLSTADLQTRLSAAYDTLDKIQNAEAYGIGTRNLRRPSLEAQLKYIDRLEQELEARTDGNVINVTLPHATGDGNHRSTFGVS